PSRRDLEVTPGAATTLWRRIAVPGPDQPLVFQAIEGGVESPRRWLAVRTDADLGANRDPVRLLIEAQDCQQNNLLELAKRGWRGHLNYIVVVSMASRQHRARRPGVHQK